MNDFTASLTLKKYENILKYKCEIDNVQVAFEYFCKIGNLSMVKHFVSLGANVRAGDDEALRLASENGHLEVVKYLVSLGANVSARDDEALRWASENGHLEVVKYLQKCINEKRNVK